MNSDLSPPSMAASNNVEVAKEKIGFFSLPAELRNKIIDLVLVPGVVYLWLPPWATLKPLMANTSTRGRFRIGAQLLATNRQAYTEGRAKYYSMNRFHLPSLSATDCQYIINRYQTKNLEMIRHVTLGCYLTQYLDEEIVKYIEWKIKKNGRVGYNKTRWYSRLIKVCRELYGPTAHSTNSRLLGLLLRVWTEKLDLIRCTFPLLESLVISQEICELNTDEQNGGTLQYKDPRIEHYNFEGSALQEDLKCLDNLIKELRTKYKDMKLFHRIFIAAHESALRLERSINVFGWEKTKTWLMIRRAKANPVA